MLARWSGVKRGEVGRRRHPMAKTHTGGAKRR
jgi:hypothetical protein